MKSEVEIRQAISGLELMKKEAELEGKDTSEYHSIINALHWVLGESSDLFN